MKLENRMMQSVPTKEDVKALEVFMRLADCPESFDMLNDYGPLRHWLNLTCNDFVTRLKKKHPLLEDRDLCLCCLLRLGYSQEQIGAARGMKKASVRRAMLRIGKLMEGLDLDAKMLTFYIRCF